MSALSLIDKILFRRKSLVASFGKKPSLDLLRLREGFEHLGRAYQTRRRSHL